MSRCVDDDKLIIGIDSQIDRISNLTRALSFSSKRTHQMAFFIEFVDKVSLFIIFSFLSFCVQPDYTDIPMRNLFFSIVHLVNSVCFHGGYDILSYLR